MLKSQTDAFESCLVCGELLPNGRVLCVSCDAALFGDERALRHHVAEWLKLQLREEYKRFGNIRRFPLMLKGEAVTRHGEWKHDGAQWRPKDVRRAKRFEKYAKGTRDIREFRTKKFFRKCRYLETAGKTSKDRDE